MIGGGGAGSRAANRNENNNSSGNNDYLANINILDPISQRLTNLKESIPDMLQLYGVASIAELKDVLIAERPGPARHFLPQAASAVSRSLVYLPILHEPYKYKVRVQVVDVNGENEQHLFLEETPFNANYILLKVLKDTKYPLKYVPEGVLILREFKNHSNHTYTFTQYGLPDIIKQRFYDEYQRYGQRWTDLESGILDEPGIVDAPRKLRELRTWQRSLKEGNMNRYAGNNTPVRAAKQANVSSLVKMPELVGNTVSEMLSGVRGGNEYRSTQGQIEELLRVINRLNPALDGILAPEPLRISANELRAQARVAFQNYNRHLEEYREMNRRLGRRKTHRKNMRRKNTIRRK